ncbi:MAG: hypothetical protein ACLFNS_07145 [Desulfobacterales bacterium]
MNKALHLLLLLFIMLLCLLGRQGNASGKTLEFPLRIDYPLLQTLIENSFFRDEGSVLRLVDPADTCRHITLSDPRLSWKNNQLQLEMAVNMQGGLKLATIACFR